MAKHKLDIDELCDLVTEGNSLRKLSVAYSVPLVSLYAFLTKNPEHAQKYRLALEMSAEACVDKAEQTLKDLPQDANTSNTMKAKSLSAFYQWLAARRNPSQYGERYSQTDVNISAKKKTIKVVINKTEDGTPEANTTSEDET